MRFKVILPKEAKHKDFVTGVGWASTDEAYSCSEDHQILAWSIINNETNPVHKLADDCYPTDLHWVPRGVGFSGSMAGKKPDPGSSIFAIATSEGKILLMSRSKGAAAKIDKSYEAHKGAVICARWNADGSALASGGEDGTVKVWSRQGMLRSTLAQLNNTLVYSLAWGPDNEQIVFTQGKSLTIKSMQPNSRPNTWKAHDGVVLKVDWCAIHGYIVSGGEDCRYRVWDSFGRPIYMGPLHDYPITSVAWSADGELFAVGAFNTLRLCDKAGWSHSLEKVNVGSLFNMSWSTDSTQLVAACGTGHVLMAHVVDRQLEWKQLEIAQVDSRTLQVRNVVEDSKETLEFKDRVIKASVGFEHLVLTTPVAAYIYGTRNWSAPVLIDLKENAVSLILQCDKYVLLADGAGLYVYTYDGRLACSPKYQNMRADLCNAQTIAMCNDTLAVRDRQDEKTVHLFDLTLGGKPLGDGKPLQHTVEVMEIAIDQFGSPNDRRLAIIDKNRDLFLAGVRLYGSQRKFVKLATMVMSLVVHETYNIFAGLSNGKFTVWHYPNVVFVDKDLLPKTVSEKEDSELGKNPTLTGFVGSAVQVRRADGSVGSVGVSPSSGLLQAHVAVSRWGEAVRLCRHVRDPRLWAALAAMALNARELDTALIAYAAIDQVDRVAYLEKIRQLGNEARAAEMALLAGNVLDAEAILVNAGLSVRAIQLNIQLYNWERALELAQKLRSHVDTVLAYRARYLATLGREETNKKFVSASEGVELDWHAIQSRLEEDLQNEAHRK